MPVSNIKTSSLEGGSVISETQDADKEEGGRGGEGGGGEGGGRQGEGGGGSILLPLVRHNPAVLSLIFLDLVKQGPSMATSSLRIFVFALCSVL